MPLTEKQKESLKRYRQKHKEKIRASQAIYRSKNRERLRELNHEIYYRNVEASRARGRFYSNANKDKIKEYRKEYMKTPNGILTSVKGSAKVRGIKYDLSDENAVKLLSNKCHYCNLLDTHIGIDRINSDEGYFLENCVPCCSKCNYMKGVYSYDDFINQCKLIAQNKT